MKKTIYPKISLYVTTILFLLLPILVIPFTHVSFLYAKFGLVSLVLFVLVVFYVIQAIDERKIGLPSPLYLFPLLSVPVVYLIASLFSNDVTSSLIGTGVETETLFTIVAGFLTMVFVARTYKKPQSIFLLSLGFILISLILSVFHVLRFFFGVNFLSFGLFNFISANTIGSFSDLGIYSGITVILSILSLEFLSLSRNMKIGLYVSLVLSFALVFVTNFYLALNLFGLSVPISLSLVLSIVSLFVFVHKKVADPKSSFPYVSLVVFLLTLILTVQAQNISGWVTKAIQATPNEVLNVRVSATDTFAISKSVISSGLRHSLLGVGPNRFFTAWALYKNTGANSVNGTIFWDTDFNGGASLIQTSLATTGILGALSWLIFLLLILYSIYRLLKSVVQTSKDPIEMYSIIAASIITLYLWFTLVFYSPGPVILFLAFFFTGILGSLLIKEDIIKIKEISWSSFGYWKSFATVFALVVSLALIVGVGYEWTNRLIASTYLDKATALISNPNQLDIPGAEENMQNAIKYNPDHGYLRLYTDIALSRPGNLISKSNGAVKTEDITQDIANDMYKAIAAAEYSAFGRSASSDYRDWLELGKVYESATFLGATTTATMSAQAYAQAEALNPTSPKPAFLLGRLMAYAHQKDLAVNQLNKALTLKPDFVEASNLLNQINQLPAYQPDTSSVVPATGNTTATSTKTTTKTKTPVKK